MIISASFKNLYSFKDKTTIDFVSGKKDWKPKDFTSVMGIFGANASGKTNVLSGLSNFMQLAFLVSPGSVFPNSHLKNIPGFMMSKEPKEFELVFTDEKAENIYKYYLKFDSEKIIEEKFEEKKGKKAGVSFVTLFHRDPEVEIPYINYELLDLSSDYYKNVQNLTTSTMLSNLFEPSRYIFQICFSLAISATSSDKYFNFQVPENFVFKFLNKESELKDQIVKTIKKFDIGLEDIEIKEISEDKYEIVEVKKSDNRIVRLDYKKSASKGTRELVKFLYFIYHFGLKAGSFVLFDEIDTLHPLILEEIINIFRSPETNPKKAQLIFTAHNPYLLDILDKNEIWFAEKNDQNSTELYSLSDFAASKDTRTGISFAKKYLAGKYGAIPKI
jgi:AAA15 family ATPase/GTPase